ncbi:hypothetical protein E2R23_13205 [Burkholderia pseudomallei]|nr:hypothetical protein EYA82_13110 [Burkholderia pseudomallei]QBP55750.1 hypothetical protein E2R23_13205 [Burkholderia pseudomallei]
MHGKARVPFRFVHRFSVSDRNRAPAVPLPGRRGHPFGAKRRMPGSIARTPANVGNRRCLAPLNNEIANSRKTLVRLSPAPGNSAYHSNWGFSLSR